MIGLIVVIIALITGSQAWMTAALVILGIEGVLLVIAWLSSLASR